MAKAHFIEEKILSVLLDDLNYHKRHSRLKNLVMEFIEDNSLSLGDKIRVTGCLIELIQEKADEPKVINLLSKHLCLLMQEYQGKYDLAVADELLDLLSMSVNTGKVDSELKKHIRVFVADQESNKGFLSDRIKGVQKTFSFVQEGHEDAGEILVILSLYRDRLQDQIEKHVDEALKPIPALQKEFIRRGVLNDFMHLSHSSEDYQAPVVRELSYFTFKLVDLMYGRRATRRLAAMRADKKRSIFWKMHSAKLKEMGLDNDRPNIKGGG